MGQKPVTPSPWGRERPVLATNQEQKRGDGSVSNPSPTRHHPSPLGQKLLNQCRVPWIGCLWLPAVDADVVDTAQCQGVGERVRCAARLKGRDVVDFEEARLAALLATPSVTI